MFLCANFFSSEFLNERLEGDFHSRHWVGEFKSFQHGWSEDSDATDVNSLVLNRCTTTSKVRRI